MDFLKVCTYSLLITGGILLAFILFGITSLFDHLWKLTGNEFFLEIAYRNSAIFNKLCDWIESFPEN